MSHILYKYLDIKGGKTMMGLYESKCIFRKKTYHPTLQFTNASQLNDPFDCHQKLIDYSNVPDIIAKDPIHKEWEQTIEENDALNLRNDTWLSSFSKVNDSILMWSHYCYNHKGVCIGLDLDRVKESVPPMFGTIYLKPLEFDVQYLDIIVRPNAYRSNEDIYKYQLATKAKDWAYEQEVRLVMPKPSAMYAAFTPKQAKEAKKDRHKVWDWKAIHHYLPLKGDCFESIYFGVNTDPKEKEKIINFARTQLNPDIKLYQMQTDESAFRLKAERI